MYYAKSNPVETIKEHTDKLLENLELLKRLYGREITKNIVIDKERFWYLLKIICIYHDVGKVFTPFQNQIREKIGLKKLETMFDYTVKHEKLSPLFIPSKELNLTKDEKKLVYQSIYYHHERDINDVDSNIIELIVNKDIIPQINEIEKELGIKINKEPSAFYLKYVSGLKRINKEYEYYNEYCLLKGLLHRLDHSSSAQINVEDDTTSMIGQATSEFVLKKFNDKNDLQKFTENNTNKNIIVIGSTGIGKTEASLLWSNKDKTFFTLPIRISINAIYDRIKNNINYSHVGLLHSTALDYLEENTEFENPEYMLDRTKNLYDKLTVTTVDQIFPFVLKYKGYEKMYSTLSYSKIIIDEIQAYSPEIVAILLKGLEMINKIGGEFLIMTATLPRIYKEALEEKGIKFEFGKFEKDVPRHLININDKNLIDDIEEIKQKSINSKVLLITNTVDESIKIYTKLKEANTQNVNLLHSRFISEDRSEKENEIKKFSEDINENGIWITTQIVEASLDIDFDYLYTEMSTLDSLFQRLGRCYRKRKYEKNEPNVKIYIKETSGIGSVYDKEIYNKSIEFLKKYDNQILNEKDKVNMVDKLYSNEELKDTEFLKKYKKSKELLENIIDYDHDKKEVQKIFRNIDNITIIPKNIYEENIELFEQYNQNLSYEDKKAIRKQINKFTLSITRGKYYQNINRIYKLSNTNKNLCDIYIADLPYDKQKGLTFEVNNDYIADSVFL